MYNKTTWKTGDVITEDKLNNLETGVSTNDERLVTVETEIEEIKKKLPSPTSYMNNLSGLQTSITEVTE